MLRFRIFSVLAFVLTVTSLQAQTAATEIAQGDRDYAAMRAPAALIHYEAAIKLDAKNTGALWKAAHAAVQLGEFADEAKQASLYQTAESYARRAATIDSNNADVRFALAEAVGRTALAASLMDRPKYATEVYANATACLAIAPKHPGCLHALGMWHAEIMRTDASLRSMAISMLGAKILEKGTWADAQRNLALAASIEPKRTIHHLDLGRVYADMGDTTKARTELNSAIKSPMVDYNDTHYKADAAAALKKLGAGK